MSDAIRETLGRSLAIRQVDAGSCNGCEMEIVALNNPVYDIERFGIHFVASPRHADMLLVTGPVTRNMELALLKTYAATPDPKVVVAVGACGISGGIFGTNYASRGGVEPRFRWMSTSPDVRRARKRCSTEFCSRSAGCRRDCGRSRRYPPGFAGGGPSGVWWKLKQSAMPSAPVTRLFSAGKANRF